MHTRLTRATEMPESPEGMPHDIPVVLNGFHVHMKSKESLSTELEYW